MLSASVSIFTALSRWKLLLNTASGYATGVSVTALAMFKDDSMVSVGLWVHETGYWHVAEMSLPCKFCLHLCPLRYSS